MSVNSSSNSSLDSPLSACSTETIYSSTAFLFIHFLLLPLYIFVLYLGHQRWRRQSPVTTSHSDIFTFNMVALELIGVMGFGLICCSLYTKRQSLNIAGFFLSYVISPAQVLFHLLTCVERYLAVVHPITYLSLRREGGVRIRNVVVVCVWLLSLGWTGLAYLNVFTFNVVSNTLFLVFALVVVSFCSLSVLRALIRPGPGEGCGIKDRLDQSKQRAFVAVTAITAALLLRFLSNLVITALAVLSTLNGISGSSICFLGLVVSCFNLPSSLVLPLLFLHRAGKLPNCKKK